MKRFSFILTIFFVIFSPFCFSANRQIVQSKLKNINQTLKEKKQDYEKTRRQYISLINQINKTDQKIKILERKIKMAKRDLNLLNGKIANLKKEIGSVSKNLEVQKEKLYTELESYYEYSKISPYYKKGVWYDYMNRFMTSYMQDRIKDYISKRKYLKSRIHTLNKYLLQKQAIVDKIKKQQQNLNIQEESLKKFAGLADKRKQQYLSEIQALTQQREKLKNLLERIIEEERKKRLLAKKKREFKALAHKIRPPVNGIIVDKFGRKYDPVFKVYTRNDGVDIKARKGVCIRVIAYGRVGYVGNLIGYGGVIIVNHLNGYYTVYGGLKSLVKTGQIVRAYQCIGRLDGSVLHFEIRRHSMPVNPLDFLDRRFLK